MSSANVIILQYVCPGVGALLSNLMCFSPVKDVHKAVREGKLGDMNPSPWLFMFGQSLGWVTYGIVHQNLWLFFSDCLGLVIAFWLNMSAIKLLYKEDLYNQQKKKSISLKGDEEESPVLNKSLLKGNLDDEDELNETHIPVLSEVYEEDSDEEDSDCEDELNVTERTIPIYDDDVEEGILNVKKREPTVYHKNDNKIQQSSFSCHDRKFMLVATLWFICISIVNLVPSITQEGREITVAMMASFNLVLFYCAPLSTMSNVLRERDSSSIHIPSMIANTVNASFWAAYGYAISDWAIIIPNGLGCLFGFVQMLLSTFIPRKSKISQPKMKDSKKNVPNDDNIAFPVRLQKKYLKLNEECS